jgi:hypothetical protein
MPFIMTPYVIIVYKCNINTRRLFIDIEFIVRSANSMNYNRKKKDLSDWLK